jgi:hypothetical protein
MAGSQTERPKFFEEQYLGADDLTAAVDYARLQQARHVLGAHTWGIAAGLQLSETPLPGGGVSVHLLPGYAWDGYGRPIVVLSPYRIPEASFAAYAFDPAVDADGKGRLIPIWLRYEEKSASHRNVSGVCCDASDQGSRIQETFAIQVGDVSGIGLTSGVNIAGRFVSDPRTSFRQFDPTAPLLSDESVPHQNFPDPSSRATWLIPVGFVRWLPTPNQIGHFVARDDNAADRDSDRIRRVRRYAGIVAEAIEAPAGAIRLRHRAAESASAARPAAAGRADDDLVWVEGSLRLAGDNRICGGSVDFRDAGGRDFDVPMRVQRSDSGPDDRALRVVIGTKAQATNRFAVSVQDGEKFEDRFVIQSGGNVGIGISRPADRLEIEGNLRITGLARKPDGGGWTVVSDERLKQNLSPLTGALELLLQLRGVRFEWKHANRTANVSGPQIGLVAQDVEKVFPQWVSTDPDGYRELTVRGFEALVIEAIRELATDVEDLRSRLPGGKSPAPKRKKAGQ